MKSITIHKLDDDVVQKIESKARSSGLSQNKIIKKLLRKALGLGEVGQSKIDLSEIAGVWSEKDYQEFVEATKDFNQIDAEEWG